MGATPYGEKPNKQSAENKKYLELQMLTRL
jgi:hypothetical protein